jgi:hypothetical protein
MSNLKIFWEDQALKLLDIRDRYTRKVIREEFSKDPQKGALPFDPDNGGFVTPVSDSRFSVVWRLEGQQAVVLAIVPLTNVSGMSQGQELKEYVQRAVRAESKGEIAV